MDFCIWPPECCFLFGWELMGSNVQALVFLPLDSEDKPIVSQLVHRCQRLDRQENGFHRYSQRWSLLCVFCGRVVAYLFMVGYQWHNCWPSWSTLTGPFTFFLESCCHLSPSLQSLFIQAFSHSWSFSLEWSACSYTNFCHDGSILDVPCPITWPLNTCSYRTLGVDSI